MMIMLCIDFCSFDRDGAKINTAYSLYEQTLAAFRIG